MLGHALLGALLLLYSNPAAARRPVELTAAQQQKVDALEFVETGALKTRDHSVLARIEGASCQRNPYNRRATEEEARLHLKIEAANLNADAIASATCERQGVSVKYNCTNRWSCSAIAVLWTGQESPSRPSATDEKAPPATTNRTPESRSHDLVSELERLSELHEKGVLSDEEFKAAKDALLKQ